MQSIKLECTLYSSYDEMVRMPVLARQTLSTYPDVDQHLRRHLRVWVTDLKQHAAIDKLIC